MSSLKISLANEEDDAELTAAIERVAMPGAMSVAFARRPSYRESLRVVGEREATILARRAGDIAGFGTYVEKKIYLNGKPAECGYLCDLRLLPSARRGVALARGYRALRELVLSRGVPFSLTMVFGDNVEARALLTSERGGLPRYESLGRIETPAILFDRPKRELEIPGIKCTRATEQDLPELLDFYANEFSRRQFAPVLDGDTLRRLEGCGLAVDDFYIARRGSKIVAAFAAWDQTKMRQVIVHSYRRPLALARPLLNAVSGALGWRPLPHSGAKLRYFYLAFAVTAEDSPQLLEVLFRFLYNERCGGPWDFCTTSFHSDDPLSAAIQGYRTLHAFGYLYRVFYPEQERCLTPLDDRVPFFEMACA